MKALGEQILGLLGDKFASAIKDLGSQRVALLVFGGFFSYSVLTFSGLYFQFPPEMRSFLDGYSWWVFFFTLNISASLSFLLTRVFYFLIRAFLIWARRFSYQRRKVNLWSNTYPAFSRSSKIISRYPLFTNIFLFMFFLSFTFLGLHMAFLFLFATAVQTVLLSLLVNFIYLRHSLKSGFSRNGVSQHRIMQIRAIQLSFAIALTSFNLGAMRLVYLSSEFIEIRLNNEDRRCVAILSQTSTGMIVATGVRLFVPLMPYQVRATSFFPMSSIERLVPIDAGECAALRRQP